MKVQVSISKTQIKNNSDRKTNPSIIEIIDLARKQTSWLPLAKVVSGPTRNYVSFNLQDLNEKVSAGDVAVIPGKVLSNGDFEKKAKICALAFSKAASEKLKKSKIDFCLISEEIKKNPQAKGVKIIK